MRNFSSVEIGTFSPWRSLAPFAVIFCLFLAGCAGEPKHPTYKNATGAEQYEKMLWQAVQQKDWGTFEQQLSGTFIGVNAQGHAFDRAGWVDFWKNAQVSQFSLGEAQVQPEGPDMKVTYVLQLQGFNSQTAGQTVPAGGLRVVSVWQQLKKGWILSATSMTPIKGS